MFAVQKYPKSMIYLHAIVAILMITVLILGWVAGSNPKAIIPVHKSLGVLVLAFALIRIINRMANISKIPVSVNHGALRIVEKAIHGLLMLVTLIMPLSGWLMSNAAGRPVSFFGLFDLPNLLAKNDSLKEVFGGVHGLCANLFVALLVLHVVGAIYHLVKEKENVISRMLPW